MFSLSALLIQGMKVLALPSYAVERQSDEDMPDEHCSLSRDWGHQLPCVLCFIENRSR